jgi:diacylglycerol kinase
VRPSRSLAESFRFALQGLVYAFRTQRNMRLHTLAATVAVVLGTLLGLPEEDFISVLAAIMVVMVAEMVNTAVEAAVDVATGHFHPLAKIAKDVAAGAVLLAAAGALTLGLWVFGPRLREVSGAWSLWQARDPAGLWIMMTVVAVVVALALLTPGRAREEDEPD